MKRLVCCVRKALQLQHYLVAAQSTWMAVPAGESLPPLSVGRTRAAPPSLAPRRAPDEGALAGAVCCLRDWLRECGIDLAVPGFGSAGGWGIIGGGLLSSLSSVKFPPFVLYVYMNMYMPSYTVYA